MAEYKYTKEKLYEHTNYGLDIIHRYLPQSVGCETSTNKKFKIRDEKTPSCSLYYGTQVDCYLITDYGTGTTYDPLGIVTLCTGLTDFLELLKKLYAEFNIAENAAYFEPNKTFHDRGTLPMDYFKLESKKEIKNAHKINRFVTPEICKLYNVYELEYTERITKKGQLMRTDSTPDYPIFAYSDDLTVWAKTYCSAERERQFKHSYFGKKPSKYYHGLARIFDVMQPRDKRIKEIREELKDTKNAFEKQKLEADLNELLLPYIIICSGGSDGLTIAGLSDEFFPVWGNSENDIIDYDTYTTLKNWCKHLCYLPDLDPSGIQFAYNYSNQYWQLPIVFIPKFYLEKNGGKDFRDFVAYFPESATADTIVREFKKFLNVPVSYNFVSVIGGKYRINTRNLNYFLNGHNFFVYNSDLTEKSDNEDNGVLVHIDEFKISIPESSKVRNFCKQFLIRKGTTEKVIDLVDSCNALRPNDLKKITPKTLDFTKYGKDFQLFFFHNTVVKVTASEIATVNKKDIKNYVWENAIIKRDYWISHGLFFENYKDENGKNRVKLLRNDCDFMNYLVNGSRVHWQKEQEADPDFRKKFVLDNPVLSEKEQITQEQHFLGKCYAIGYLLHRQKRFDFQRFVYIVDDDVKDNISEANGGTGKGLFSQGIKCLANVHEEDGKKKDLFGDRHFLGGLDESHDIILFQDMARQSDGFERLYNLVTDSIVTRPLQQKTKTFPFQKSPKIMGTFNYGVKDMDNGSTQRRLLFVSYSSYYHAQKDDLKEYTPVMDFGHQFFEDWDKNQWNTFYNFMLFCVQFYLKNYNDYSNFLSPTENVNINNLKASIGDNFIEWADGYFVDENLNNEIPRAEIYANYETTVGAKYKIGGRLFKQHLEKYCRLKGYVFNPERLRGKDGRIIRTATIATGGRTSIEYFYIETQEPTDNEPVTDTAPEKEDNIDIDDLAF
jgi:hypothetical protein